GRAAQMAWYTPGLSAPKRSATCNRTARAWAWRSRFACDREGEAQSRKTSWQSRYLVDGTANFVSGPGHRSLGVGTQHAADSKIPNARSTIKRGLLHPRV